MQFSIWPSPSESWDDILALSQHCESTGWHGVYFADHFMPNGPDDTPLDGDTIECWSVLAGLAAAVPRVKLAPLVTSVTYRHPAVLANIAAAVDHISAGRLTLGVGAGWQENEHAAYGLTLGSVRERLDRFEEACAVLRGMLDGGRTTFDGEHFSINDAPNQPEPVQQKLPLLVGGGGEKRTMRIAAEYADEWNAWTTPEQLRHKIEVMHGHCDDLGRDPDEIHVSTQGLLFLSDDEEWLADKRGDIGRSSIVGTPEEVVEQVAAYRDAGCDELIIPGFTLGSRQRAIETCEMFMNEVVPAL